MEYGWNYTINRTVCVDGRVLTVRYGRITVYGILYNNYKKRLSIITDKLINNTPGKAQVLLHQHKGPDGIRLDAGLS